MTKKTAITENSLNKNSQLPRVPSFLHLICPHQKEKLALKDILSKGKLTIVQFWASNSYNIETIQSDLVALYNKYHNKGLNVVGVSSDTSANKWKGTIF